MALQRCPYRAELKSASEIRDLCGNVVGQDGGSTPPFLLLDPAWRKGCFAEGSWSISSALSHPLDVPRDSLRTPVGLLRDILGSGEVNILQFLTGLSKDKCSHRFEAFRHGTAWGIKLIANFV